MRGPWRIDQGRASPEVEYLATGASNPGRRQACESSFSFSFFLAVVIRNRDSDIVVVSYARTVVLRARMSWRELELTVKPSLVGANGNFSVVWVFGAGR